MIGAKRVTGDREFVLTFSFTASPADIPNTLDLKPGSFVVVVYENDKWLELFVKLTRKIEMYK